MKTVKIEKEKLFNIIEQELRNMNKYGMSGWGVPIYVDYDGDVTAGNVISHNTWSEGDFFELFRIESWEDENQGSLTLWYNDNLPENIKKICDDFLDQNGYEIDSIESIKPEELPEECKKDFEEYQDIVIDDAIDRIMDYYRDEKIPQRIEEIEHYEGIEIELI